MKYMEVPLSSWDEQHQRTAYLDKNEIAGLEIYEGDRTVTVLFKSGTKMKYGPFSEVDFNNFIDSILL